MMEFVEVLSMTEVAVACIGLLFNLAVIYVTVRAEWLHFSCNILLAVYECCLLPFDVQKLLEELYFEDAEFTAIQCFWMISPFFALFVASFILMTAVALDRCLSVLFPIRYQKLDKRLYIAAIFTLALINALCLLVLAYAEAAQAPDQEIHCGITSTLEQNALYFSLLALGCQLLSAAMYALLWFRIRKTGNQLVGGNTTTKRIFKSLLCILAVSLLGFAPTSIYYIVTDKLLHIPNFWHPDSMLGKVFMEATENLALLACSSNAVILFVFSHEYRRAFCQYLPFLRYLVKNNSTSPSLQINRNIGPTGITQLNNTSSQRWIHPRNSINPTTNVY